MSRFPDIFTRWNELPIASEAELSRADVIITHEFGDQQHVSTTTKGIVECALAISARHDIPLACQFPGNCVAEAAGITPIAIISEHVLRPGTYLDTEEVNRQVAELCRAHGWTRAILCTHPHHAWRARENLARHGITAFLPKLRSVRYDPACPRFALRSGWTFAPREMIARGLYLAKGLI